MQDANKKLRNAKTSLTLVRKDLKLTLEELSKKKNLLKFYETYKVKKVSVIKPFKYQDAKSEQGTVISLLSDVHAEHKITLAQTNNFNRFTPDICKSRLTHYFNNLVKLTELTRGGITLDNLVLGLLGDLIHGFIHEEYHRTNYLTPIEATMFVTDELRRGIQFILDHGKFKNIVIVCKIGNHSRTTHKVYSDEEAKHSYEWGIYQTLARLFPDITWIIDESYFTYMKIYDKMLRFHHGHAFRYMGGVGGIYIPLIRYILKVNRQMKANMDFIGHWHTRDALSSGACIMNGSICGADPYSIRMGFPIEPPTQQFQILDARRGFTANFPIICE